MRHDLPALPPDSLRTAPRWALFAGMVFMLAVGLLALRVALPRDGQFYTPDSASYIEQARSLLAGKGFASRPDGIDNLDAGPTPDRLFPPGYPLVIAAASMVSGAPVESAALWVSRIAFLLLPLTVFLAFRPIIGIGGAGCVGILSGLSAGVIAWGPVALSDALSLTLVVTSFGLTLAAWPPRPTRSGLLFAMGGGVLAGFAYLTRNADLAFLIAVPVSIGIWFLISPPSERDATWRVGLSWTIGAAVVVVPWLARNAVVFGSVQPYTMPPSTVSAWSNVRAFIGAQAYDVLGSQYWGTVAGSTAAGLVTLLLATMAFVYLTTRRWATLQPGEQRAFGLSIMYALLGAAVVIAARTKYEWGEHISERHALQYTPFLLLAAAIVLQHISRRKLVLIASSAAIMLVLIALRRNALLHNVSNKPPLVEVVQQYRSRGMEPCARGNQSLLVSNFAYLYRILCDADARYPGDGGMGGRSIPEALTWIESKVGQRPVTVAFHPGLGIDSSAMPLPAGSIRALETQGWMIRDNSSLALVLARQRP